MDALAKLLALSDDEKKTRGLVYTPGEVVQQPETWRLTFEKVLTLASPLNEFLTRAGLNARGETPLTVLLIGAGTSDYIGKSVSALLQKQWNCDVHAVPSTDLLTNMDEHVIPGRRYLWISFSRSGDSSEGVAVLRTARERYPDFRHIIITCNERGQMARSADNERTFFSIVLDEVVNDRGLAMTSSFSNMVIVAQALAHIRDLQSYGLLLDELVSVASKLRPVAAHVCERLVSEGFSKVCFLGTGALKGAAIESALKVLELTDGRVMSFAESFLGIRHGPLSAIDRDTLVVSFLSGNERTRAFELDLVHEIREKELTTKRLSVSPVDGAQNGLLAKENTLHLGLPKPLADVYRPPIDVLIGQLLGLFASIREGLKPDTPSPHGALSRVVSHVRIY